ncbi:MAG: efflux transporter periplasmic adaptor subunit [Alphaproteobacteria bacterium]|jgi:RND family efflux transporter MFP subunit|nr:efflux transporter periplasmic adaptor subunit [Alphaproteobacteria bacterium]
MPNANMIKSLPRKQLTFAVIACAVLAGMTIMIFSSNSNAADEKAGPKPALTVSTVKPMQTTLPIKLAANGNIMAWQETVIGSQSTGLRLTKVNVNVGDKVKAGQLLAQFESAQLQADVEQARAGLLEAKANAAEAADNAARARTLQTTGALSTQQINQYLTAEQTASARVKAAEATLAAQMLRLKYGNVMAPDDGVISARNATVGAVVPAGTELFRMILKGRLEWRAEVTATELGRIRSGTVATLVAANGTALSGKVRMVGPTVDPQSRNALVYVDLDPSSSKVAPPKAGMYARGEFNLGTSNALTVPQQAVVLREGFSYVFRVNPDSRVSQIKIRTGRRIGEQVEVLEGLNADAVLVSAGAGFLNEGDLVRVVSPAAVTSPAPAPARKT